MIITVMIIGCRADPFADQARLQGDALAACNKFVEARLRAPATAVFPDPSVTEFYETPEEHAEITSYVDAQNAYGALIRTKFTCVVKPLPDGRWDLVDLKMPPDQ